MSNLLPEKWREALERVYDKAGNLLSKISPRKKDEHSPERLTADAFPASIQFSAPSLDMDEFEDELVIRAELPGLGRDDFSVEVSGRELTIKGEKKMVNERKGGDGCCISECRYGAFSRTVRLPYEIDEKSVAADLKNGLLTIRLKKPENMRRIRYRVPVS